MKVRKAVIVCAADSTCQHSHEFEVFWFLFLVNIFADVHHQFSKNNRLLQPLHPAAVELSCKLPEVVEKSFYIKELGERNHLVAILEHIGCHTACKMYRKAVFWFFLYFFDCARYCYSLFLSQFVRHSSHK